MTQSKKRTSYQHASPGIHRKDQCEQAKLVFRFEDNIKLECCRVPILESIKEPDLIIREALKNLVQNYLKSLKMFFPLSPLCFAFLDVSDHLEAEKE